MESVNGNEADEAVGKGSDGAVDESVAVPARVRSNKQDAVERKRRARMRRVRYAATLGVLAACVVGIALNTGLGSLCAFGVADVAAVCPVGILETAIAGRGAGTLPIFVLLAAIVGSVLVGRAFCGWACPVPLVRKLVTGKGEEAAWEVDRKRAGCVSCGSCDDHRCAPEGLKRRREGRFGIEALSGNAKSALGVLGATLASSLVFGFPVFCLLCPVGLVFATVLSIVRLVAFNELAVDVVVFPALVIAELVLLRHWCSSLCPIGALLGLFARAGRTFRPQVDAARCLVATQGASCDACRAACPSDIDLVRSAGSGAIADCIRCGECAAHCPTNAISFPAAGRPRFASATGRASDDPLSDSGRIR